MMTETTYTTTELKDVDCNNFESSETENTNTSNCHDNDETKKDFDVLKDDDKEGDKEESLDEESEDEDDEETEVLNNFPTLILKQDSEKYVITMDGIPQCYTTTIEDARKRMWEFARLRKMHEHNYRSYIREGSTQNHISVIGYQKFYAISYDRILSELSINKIQEIQEVQELEDKTEDDVDDDSSKQGIMASLFG
jgi:hypothetical protein